METFRVLVVYHFQKVPENLVGKQMEHNFLGRFSKKKISGGNGTSEKLVVFFRTEYLKRKFVFHFFRPIFDTSFRPLRPFFGKWN